MISIILILYMIPAILYMISFVYLIWKNSYWSLAKGREVRNFIPRAIKVIVFNGLVWPKRIAEIL